MTQLFSGDQLTYTTVDQFFTIVNPIEMLSEQPIVASIAQVTGLTAYRNFWTGMWLGSFAFIEEDDTTIDLFYYKGSQMDLGVAPKFTSTKTAFPKDGMKCFAIDYSTSDSRFLIDCQTVDPIAQTVQDSILVTDTNPGTSLNIFTVPTRAAVEAVTRISHVHRFRFKNIGGYSKTQYLMVLRCMPTYGAKSFAGTLNSDTFIEAFLVQEDGQPEDTPKFTIDVALLKSIYGVTKKLSIVDFKILGDGDIYVQDVIDGIYIFNINEAFKVTLKKKMSAAVYENHFGFDVVYRQTISGDINEMVAVIYKDKVLVFMNNVRISLQDLPKTSAFGDSVHLNQKYVIVRQGQNAIMLETDQYRLVAQKVIDGDWMVNPNLPDLITITKTTAQRWQLSDGLLTIKPALQTDTLKTVDLIATPPVGTSCRVPLTYQIYGPADTQVLYNKDPFPIVYTVPSDPIPLDTLVGPSITYKTSSTNVHYTVQSVWNFNANDLPKDVIFSDIATLKNSNTYYLFLQTKDLKCTIYQCHHKLYQTEDSKCEVMSSYTASIQIKNFAWYIEYGALHFIYQESEYSIVIYTASDQDPVKNLHKNYYVNDQSPKVMSFTLLQSQLYVVLTSGTIDVLSVSNKFESIQVIDSTLMKAQGFQSIFLPQKVFGNKLIKPQLVFIQSYGYLLMGVYDEGFNLLQKLKILDADIELAIGLNSFFLCIKSHDGLQDSIVEYDYSRINNIIKLKTLPISQFDYIMTSQFDYCIETGFLMVRVNKNQRSSLMIFKPMQVQKNSIFQIIDLNIAATEPLLMNIDGIQQMFIYLHHGNQNIMYSLLPDAMLFFSPSMNIGQQAYVNTATVQLTYGSVLSDQAITKRTEVTLLDTLSYIQMSSNVVVESSEKLAPLGNQWFSGQITKFACESCTDIRQPIWTNATNAIISYDIRQGVSFSKDLIVHQARQQLVFQAANQNGELIRSIQLDQKYSCTLLTAADNMIFSFCTLNEKYFIQLQFCNAKTCTAATNVVEVPSIMYVIQIQYVSKCLILLDTNPYQYNSYASQLIVYYVQVEGQSFKLQNRQELHFKEFAPAYIQSFDAYFYTYSGNDYVKILMTNGQYGLLTYDARSTNDGWIRENLEGQDLRTFLTEDAKQYVRQTTVFQQVKILSSKTESQRIKMTYLITTSDVAQYAIYTEFKLEAGIPVDRTTRKLAFMLSQYGSWRAQNKVAISSKYIAIPYTNDYEDQIVLAMYEIPKEFKYVSFKAALPTEFNGFEFSLVLTENYLYTNIEPNRDSYNNLNTYTIDQLRVSGGPNVVIKGSNDFGSAQTLIKINPRSSSPSSNWWWITLIVVVCVIGVGIGGFFVYTRYFKRTTYPLLDH